jgi:hypothetical protein
MTARELADRPDAQFIVAGIEDNQDPDVIRPEDLAQMSEISFLGLVEDMPPLLRECDIVLLTNEVWRGNTSNPNRGGGNRSGINRVWSSRMRS